LRRSSAGSSADSNATADRSGSCSPPRPAIGAMASDSRGQCSLISAIQFAACTRHASSVR
jgi:hypothetical protein